MRLAAFSCRLLGALTLATLAGCSKPAPPPPPPPPPPPRAEIYIPDAPSCAKPVEKAAFDTVALQTRLMISGLDVTGCGNFSRYNEFVAKNKAELNTQRKNLSLYFNRNYGKSSQKALDDYISELANVQAQFRTRDADAFCKDTNDLLIQASGIKTGKDLVSMATKVAVPQPMKLAACQ
jgi:hypothetical protein